MRKFTLVFGLAVFGLALTAAPVTVYVHDYPPYYNAGGEGYAANIIKPRFPR
jgi:hypothetical protein